MTATDAGTLAIVTISSIEALLQTGRSVEFRYPVIVG
jgi:hypothetical protein